MNAFLSVYTPTYKRPALLEACRASVEAQRRPVEHVVIPDEVGLGVGGMFAASPRHAPRCTGAYVMVLSDDDVLSDDGFAVDLEREALATDLPDVILFKGYCGQTLQPLVWGGEPRLEKINLSCFAVRRGLWSAHAGCWGARYEGDYDFIHHLWRCGYRLHWWDRIGFRTQGEPRHGAPE